MKQIVELEATKVYNQYFSKTTFIKWNKIKVQNTNLSTVLYFIKKSKTLQYYKY